MNCAEKLCLAPCDKNTAHRNKLFLRFFLRFGEFYRSDSKKIRFLTKTQKCGHPPLLFTYLLSSIEEGVSVSSGESEKLIEAIHSQPFMRVVD